MDLRPFKGVDQVRDATLSFDDLGPLEFVYSEHFLEHLPLDGAICFLQHSLSALKPGGKIRLATPGLEWVILTHFQLGVEDSDKVVSMTLAINRAFHGWGHQFLWSKPILQKTLEAVGFENVSSFEFGESDTPELRELERHGDSDRRGDIANIWIFEGTKSTINRLPDTDFLNMIDHNYSRYVRGGH